MSRGECDVSADDEHDDAAARARCDCSLVISSAFLPDSTRPSARKRDFNCTTVSDSNDIALSTTATAAATATASSSNSGLSYSVADAADAVTDAAG